MAFNPIHRCLEVHVAVSRGPGDEHKQYGPRKRESAVRDLQTVQDSGKDGKGKQSGIIKTQKVIEKRSEVRSL